MGGPFLGSWKFVARARQAKMSSGLPQRVSSSLKLRNCEAEHTLRPRRAQTARRLMMAEW